jgi:hypothetical protein
MPTQSRSTTTPDTTPSATTPSATTPSATTPDGDGRARGASAVAGVLTFPVRVAGAVVGDISSTARRPDALLYWAGLAGAAVVGAIEWPVAAAIGVGVAVAHGVRRGRP